MSLGPLLLLLLLPLLTLLSLSGVDGSPCIFPFDYYGTVYYACVWVRLTLSTVQYSTVLYSGTRVTVHDVSCSNPSSPRVGAPRRWTAQVATLVTGRSVTPSVPSARLWTVSSAE